MSESSIGSISSPGLGSGIDIQAMIDKLMEVQNKPILLLNSQEAKLQTTLSAFGGLKSTLAQFQTSLQSLNTTSSYQNFNATVANTAIAGATASSSAVAGTYSLLVSQLAQSQTLIATGQASATNPIGTGTISFTFGTINGTVTDGKYGDGTTFTGSGAAPKTVTIDSSNNSLDGIAAAINAANIGVTANVLNDGSGTPYRLSLTSTETGEATSMKIAVDGDPALANLLNYDPTATAGQNLTQTSVAQNAKFTLNGLAITSSKNSNSSVIPGVTLNLLSANPTTPTTLTVTQSNSAAIAAVNSFVSAYNTISSAIANATAYNAETKQAGVLQGQSSVLSITNAMQRILNSPVPGAPNGMSMLAQVGITFSSDGTMKLDSATLEAALASNPSGVVGLFASVGTASDSLIQLKGSTNATQPGAYAVNITQIATQGNTTGSAAANTTITKGVNDTLQVSLNGVTANVVLAAGSYTSDSLAAAVQTAINTNSAFKSSSDNAVSVTQNGGVLSITSTMYGSKSAFSVTGGNGMNSLLGSSATTTNGVDVAGTIGGQSATGKGQVLTASAGNPTGLSIVINGGTLGARGTINFTEGYANELNNLMTNVLGDSGQIEAVTDGINASIKDIQKSVQARTSLNKLMLANYQQEFLALDVTLSKLSSTSDFLKGQLAALSAQFKSQS